MEGVPMASTTQRWLFVDSRRALRFFQPATQLRLPLTLLAVTLVFGLLFTWQVRGAYRELYAMVPSTAPPAFQAEITAQTRVFLLGSAAVAAAYALTILGVCIAYTGRLIGPMVALRRHVQFLKNGNYRMRLVLREGDTAFRALAEDLNELTELLAHERGQRRARQAPSG